MKRKEPNLLALWLRVLLIAGVALLAALGVMLWAVIEGWLVSL
jgi:hypothetical protein